MFFFFLFFIQLWLEAELDTNDTKKYKVVQKNETNF